MTSPSPCPCGNPHDPQVVSNPPGLTAISDRVADFTGFRRALLRPLPGERALGPWRPAAGDLGLQYLEWWAYISDVLTFYNERIANESYLRTAQFPESIAGLVALLGYVPAPGLAATGVVGAVRTTKRPAEPLIVPDGMPLSSTPTPGVPPQTFEAAAARFPGPSDVAAALIHNRLLDVRTDDSGQDVGPASVLLAGKVGGVRAGDHLLLVEKGWAGRSDNWAAVTVDSADPETDLDSGAVNTRVAFTAAAIWGTVKASALVDIDPGLLGQVVLSPSTSRFSSFQILSKTSLFGMSNVWKAGLLGSLGSIGTAAPPGPSTQSGPRLTHSYRLLRPTADASLWNLTSTDPTPVKNTTNPVIVSLSATVRSIQPGDLVFFDGGTTASSVLGQVTGTSDKMGKTDFPGKADTSIVVPYTQLSVRTSDPATLGGYETYSPVTVRHAFRDVGAVLPNPPAPLSALPVAVKVPAGFTLRPGQSQALLEDANGAGTIVQVAPNPTSDGTTQLVLTALPPAPETFDPPLQLPLRLLFDVVAVSRGTTVNEEVLGSGNAAVVNQRFTLKKSPLTYLATGAGWTAALSVYVDGIKWKEVPTLYRQPHNAQVYVVERAPDQSATIRFGDGLNGSRLPSGSGNVVATYRYGSGAAGPPAGRLTTVLSRQPNLAAIHNPVPVSGGKDPQSPANVKTDAPASVFAFGRAISAVDYEVVAAQAAGVSRVKAYWTFDAVAQRTLVKIYVNDDAGGVTSAGRALTGSDDPNRPVAVAAARQIDVSVSARLVVSADRIVDDVVAAAAAAFADPDSGAFSPAAMGIGQWLYRSHIDAALSVSGVVAVHELRVTWHRPGLNQLSLLDEMADPGEGAFFSLPATNLTLTEVLDA